MNILVIAQYFPPDSGGASTRASNVVIGLLEKGCKVTVISAFPHYPLGKIPASYRHKPIITEEFKGAKIFNTKSSVLLLMQPLTLLMNMILILLNTILFRKV